MLGDALICFDAALLHQQIWNSTRKVSWGKKILMFENTTDSIDPCPPNQPFPEARCRWRIIQTLCSQRRRRSHDPSIGRRGKGIRGLTMPSWFLCWKCWISLSLAYCVFWSMEASCSYHHVARACDFFLALSSRSPHVSTWWQIERKNNVLTAGFWSHTQKMHGFQLGLHS